MASTLLRAITQAWVDRWLAQQERDRQRLRREGKALCPRCRCVFDPDEPVKV